MVNSFSFWLVNSFIHYGIYVMSHIHRTMHNVVTCHLNMCSLVWSEVINSYYFHSQLCLVDLLTSYDPISDIIMVQCGIGGAITVSKTTGAA